MLPEKLSNKLCSLRPGEPKLTFSAVFEITPLGRVASQWFGRTIINSNYRFAYETAQQIIDAGQKAMKMELRGGTDGRTGNAGSAHVADKDGSAMGEGVTEGMLIPDELKSARHLFEAGKSEHPHTHGEDEQRGRYYIRRNERGIYFKPEQIEPLFLVQNGVGELFGKAALVGRAYQDRADEQRGQHRDEHTDYYPFFVCRFFYGFHINLLKNKAACAPFARQATYCLAKFMRKDGRGRAGIRFFAAVYPNLRHILMPHN